MLTYQYYVRKLFHTILYLVVIRFNALHFYAMEEALSKLVLMKFTVYSYQCRTGPKVTQSRDEMSIVAPSSGLMLNGSA